MSSIECTELTRELIEVCAAYPEKIAPHFHVCLQSGSERVLHRMRRRWGPRRFVDRCRMLQERLDLPAITTDIIVGFPGETDTDFAETMAVAREVGFSKIHIFPYSTRRGTDAATYTDQVPAPIRQQRVEQLEALGMELRDQYYRQLIGRKLRLLAENPPAPEISDRMLGTACRYAVVEFPGTTKLRKQFVDVQVTELRDGQLQGLPVSFDCQVN